jgi:hypothetical protein
MLARPEADMYWPENGLILMALKAYSYFFQDISRGFGPSAADDPEGG